jgi:hypothetical protein
VQRTRGDPYRWPLFVGLSVGLHVAAFDAARSHEASTPRAFDASSQPLAGDTLDVEPSPTPPDDFDDPVTSPSLGAAPAAIRAPSPPSPASMSAASRTSAAASATNASAAAPAHTAQFGAVGVRFASDLATTFTRAFPQAASADPVWSATSFGSVSSTDITLVLDEEGHLARSAIGGSPSSALRRGIERTLALLGTGRAFTAHGAVTRIRITARVTRDDIHDGLHGDVFALSGGSFAGDVGTAFFALPPSNGPGRRIDVELRLLP